MHPYRRVTGVLVALVFALVFSRCVTIPAVQPTPAQEPIRIRFGSLPVLDVIPFFVALQEGYFEEEGLLAEAVPVSSAPERNTLMQTGQIDAQLNELTSTGLFNQGGAKITIVRTARRAYPDAPLFRILAAPNSGLTTPEDLKGVPIAISQNTVIHYITDRMLEGAGLTAADIVVQEVTQIPVRFELLMKGEVKAATLPDPLAQGAMAAGATLIVDDAGYPDLSQSVISFRNDFIRQHPDAVRRFLRAWEKAVQAINAHPEKYQDLLIQQGRVPESIRGTYKMPPFPERDITTEAEWQDAVAWLQAKGLVQGELPYAESVDASYLP